MLGAMTLPPELQEELEGLERRLRSLAEAPMRRECLLERLEALGPAEAYPLVSAALARSGGAGPDRLLLREVLHEVLREGGASRPVPYALSTGIYAEASAHDDEFVMRLLRAPAAAESMETPERALHRSVAELPLGTRRALARGAETGVLEKLLLDPDPIVMTHLLQNPRITETHVVRIAARRPIPAETLRAIARSRRFGARTAVRVAVARNPYCPTDVAVGLLATLPVGELREVAGDATLHPITRRHADAELRRREAPAGDG
jgi:hypothetical protein